MSDATQLPPLDPVGEDLELLMDPSLPAPVQGLIIAAYKMGRNVGRHEVLEAVKAIHARAR